MEGDDVARMLRSIGEAIRADMRGLTDDPPPKPILLQVLHLIRREQEPSGMKQVAYDDLPDHLRLLLEQLRKNPAGTGVLND